MNYKDEHDPRWPYDSAGIDDGLFIRGKVPMTKSEIRAVVISKLKLSKGMTFMDIGAGTGSVSIEAGLKGCRVTALEKKEEGVALIGKNAMAFGVGHITILQGNAPEDLPKNQVFDRIFIGGTGGSMAGIFEWLERHLRPGGIVVANTVTVENSSRFFALMTQYGYDYIQGAQVNVSRTKAVGDVHMMLAENPVTVISAVKPLKKGRENG